MILLRAAGCGWEPDEGIRVRLRATAAAFLAAGGAVTLTEWASLTAGERAALTEAAAHRARPGEDEEDRARRLLLAAVDAVEEVISGPAGASGSPP